MKPEQKEIFKAETTWFHVFNEMINSGDVAKIGPHAVTVYLVIKSFTNWKTGRAFPAIETIVEKSGISRAQVMRSLATLTEYGYLEKEKQGRKNVYTLREKITFNDHEGRPSAVASWDYLPSAMEEVRAELKKFMTTGEHNGQIVYIENLNLQLNVNHKEAQNNQVNAGEAVQKELAPHIQESLNKMKAKLTGKD